MDFIFGKDLSCFGASITRNYKLHRKFVKFFPDAWCIYKLNKNFTDYRIYKEMFMFLISKT